MSKGESAYKSRHCCLLKANLHSHGEGPRAVLPTARALHTLSLVSLSIFLPWFIPERGDDHILGNYTSSDAFQTPRKGRPSYVLCKHNRLSVGQGLGRGWP